MIAYNRRLQAIANFKLRLRRYIHPKDRQIAFLHDFPVAVLRTSYFFKWHKACPPFEAKARHRYSSKRYIIVYMIKLSMKSCSNNKGKASNKREWQIVGLSYKTDSSRNE